LYEELLIGENVRQTAHPRIMAANEVSLNWKDMAELLRQLEHHCDHFAVERIVQLITEAPTGFSHSSAVCDLVDLQPVLHPVDKFPVKVAELTELPVAMARLS
jgi:FlaA1/EpsC-like NDP-sugar epimerase